MAPADALCRSASRLTCPDSGQYVVRFEQALDDEMTLDALPAPNVKDDAGKPRAIDAANADARALVPAPTGSVTLEQRAVILATAGASCATLLS